jgi:aspartyl aminopeptidase
MPKPHILPPSDAATRSCRDLLSYIEASPSPYHCVIETRRRLEDAGFSGLNEAGEWRLAPGDQRFVIRGDGSILAFRVGRLPPSEAGFHVVGAHTDSPNLRLKPRPGKRGGPYLLFDVEIYGGVLLATWTDRDLGLAGRVLVDTGDGLETRLLRIDRPLCRISNLAIHLDREVNEEGLRLDRHQHLPPAVAEWAGGGEADERVLELVAEAAGTEPDRIRGHELCLYDVQAPAIGGIDGEFVYAARLDNQAMCHAGLAALLRADADPDPTVVVALFDHEEIGSTTSRGAAGPLLRDVLGRIAEAFPAKGGLSRAVSKSFLISADMAHAVHPTRPERHDGKHLPTLNAGPVLKSNANQRYATDAETGALFRALCREAEVPMQEFAMRADMPCGSTIGPISAADLGIRTVDVGNPMLSMHSAREMGGSRDPEAMIRVLSRFLSGHLAATRGA